MNKVLLRICLVKGPEGHCVQGILGPAGAQGALLWVRVARVPEAQRGDEVLRDL